MAFTPTACSADNSTTPLEVPSSAGPTTRAIATPRLLNSPMPTRYWSSLPQPRWQRGTRSLVGASWTTDAPFRETAQAIEAARAKGVLAVEMEAAALHTFASAAGVGAPCMHPLV
ncbi:hypothetical protein ACFIOY_24155 [Bradyrhizobium sp. TZ2]